VSDQQESSSAPVLCCCPPVLLCCCAPVLLCVAEAEIWRCCWSWHEELQRLEHRSTEAQHRIKKFPTTFVSTARCALRPLRKPSSYFIFDLPTTVTLDPVLGLLWHSFLPRHRGGKRRQSKHRDATLLHRLSRPCCCYPRALFSASLFEPLSVVQHTETLPLSQHQRERQLQLFNQTPHKRISPCTRKPSFSRCSACSA
jgi:hypothetical protein